MRFDCDERRHRPLCEGDMEEILGAPAGTGVKRRAAAGLSAGIIRTPNRSKRLYLVAAVTGPPTELDFSRRLRRRRRTRNSDRRAGHVRDAQRFARDPHRARPPRTGLRRGATGRARVDAAASRAAERGVAEALGIRATEDPTGWSSSPTSLDAGLIGECGEESAGAGSAQRVREKAGSGRCSPVAQASSAARARAGTAAGVAALEPLRARRTTSATITRKSNRSRRVR